MDYLFEREQKILDDVLNSLCEVRNGAPVSPELFELLAKEYGLMLKHMKKIVSISDKASGVLIDEQKFRQEKINELENKLLQNQISIMLSQIQPHFIFNSLTAIKHLCRTDPKLAEETIVEFSDYLRGNLDSLTIRKPILFERELHHVKTYLNIEKKRFGSKLNIIYDIKAKDFTIPVLTLQPIVENAVRYGITKKEQDGTVIIKTEETETDFIITVTDDGAGFEQDENSYIETIGEERQHIGIKNVRERLSAMCGGTLEIQSKPKEGTVALIMIPKDGQLMLKS